MHLFENASLGRLVLPNRIIRSATYEGRCDHNGFPTPEYMRLYADLAQRNIGAIITGFAYINKNGRAMQPLQAGIDSDEKIPRYAEVTRKVHANGGRIILQIAHAGRQTNPSLTGGTVYSPGTRQSPYFRARPERLTAKQIESIIDDFGKAAYRSQQAGFDGVQLHAAHGYLVHQFINPAINDRTDAFGINSVTGIGTLFLERIIARLRELCGKVYPLLVKISAGDEYRHGIKEVSFRNLVQFLDSQPVDAIEISWGTMDQALNIFRGSEVPVETILDFNPFHRQKNPLLRFVWKLCALPVLKHSIKPFSPVYNLSFATLARSLTKIPVICVGGFRTGQEAEEALSNSQTDFVSVCRPFIRQPSIAEQWHKDSEYRSTCTNCNRCSIRCDSAEPTRCHYHPRTMEE